MTPHIQNRAYSKTVVQSRDLQSILIENYKLYSAFSNLIYIGEDSETEDMDSSTVYGG